jgi:hypothetical protein
MVVAAPFKVVFRFVVVHQRIQYEKKTQQLVVFIIVAVLVSDKDPKGRVSDIECHRI